MNAKKASTRSPGFKPFGVDLPTEVIDRMEAFKQETGLPKWVTITLATNLFELLYAELLAAHNIEAAIRKLSEVYPGGLRGLLAGPLGEGNTVGGAHKILQNALQAGQDKTAAEKAM